MKRSPRWCDIRFEIWEEELCVNCENEDELDNRLEAIKRNVMEEIEHNFADYIKITYLDDEDDNDDEDNDGYDEFYQSDKDVYRSQWRQGDFI